MRHSEFFQRADSLHFYSEDCFRINRLALRICFAAYLTPSSVHWDGSALKSPSTRIHSFAVESNIDTRRAGDWIVVVPRRDWEAAKVLLHHWDL